MNFQSGDPGKRVDAHVPTPLWKKLREVAAKRDLTLGAAAHVALEEWVKKHGD